MPKLFGVDVANEVNKAMGPGLLDATLTVVTPGTRTAGSLSGGVNPTTTTHTAKGFIEDYKDFQIDETIIQRGDRMVLLLGDSIFPAAIPTPGDRVNIESEDFNVVNVTRDPAAATYTMQVRG
jgi:hypothetical protein